MNTDDLIKMIGESVGFDTKDVVRLVIDLQSRKMPRVYVECCTNDLLVDLRWAGNLAETEVLVTGERE